MNRPSSKLSSSMVQKNTNNNSSRTKKNKTPSATKLLNEIVQLFMNMLVTAKLYHWHTVNYAEHKATDEFYETINSHIDEFVEVFIGKYEIKFNMTPNSHIKTGGPATTNNEFIKCIDGYTKTFTDICKSISHPELLAIRDDILGDINKLKFLFKLS